GWVACGAHVGQVCGAATAVHDCRVLACRLVNELAALHVRGAIHHDLRTSSTGFDAATGAHALATPPLTEWRTAALSEGALPYISPEQTGQMNRPIDCRSDLYSLGVVLYQLLADRLPFEADDAVVWVHWHVARQPG